MGCVPREQRSGIGKVLARFRVAFGWHAGKWEWELGGVRSCGRVVGCCLSFAWHCTFEYYSRIRAHLAQTVVETGWWWRLLWWCGGGFAAAAAVL